MRFDVNRAAIDLFALETISSWLGEKDVKGKYQ
jgi:hypothetical protein